ncbi:HET-domain-containing protein, partial [Canariomyces notabilis]
MRLLSTRQIGVTEVYGSNIPRYAILSHTWTDDEVLLQDLQALGPADWDLPDGSAKGFSKLQQSTALARRNGFDYIWIDTCCIDKTSSAELSEAINSMYRWYQDADVCYAYLEDVRPAGTEDPMDERSSFRRSRWFTRGWTLQELIAPSKVEFFAGDWSYLGNKTESAEFTSLLHQITGVQHGVLTGHDSLADISIASVRMRWAAFRETTRVEDIAYCLLGLFDVNMPLLYGEGTKAFIRLQEEILLRDDDQSLFAWYTDDAPEELDDADTVGTVSRLKSLSGLLADSPRRFWATGDIATATPLALGGEPAALTSRGLRVDLFL